MFVITLEAPEVNKMVLADYDISQTASEDGEIFPHGQGGGLLHIMASYVSKKQSGQWVNIIDHWSIIDHFA